MSIRLGTQQNNSEGNSESGEVATREQHSMEKPM
jgi:hypothetical protein